MKRLLTSFILVLTLVVAGPASSAVADANTTAEPDLATLMDKYVNAIGGRDLLGKINSQIAVFGFTLLGRQLIVTTTVKVPSYFLEVTQAEGGSGKIIVGFDGKTAWIQGADGSVHILTGEKRAAVIAQASGANNSEIFPERWPTTVTKKPTETIEGKSYYVLSIQPKGGIEHDLLLDTQTFRPVILRQVESDVSSISIVNEFSSGPMGELFTNNVTTTRSDGVPPITSTLRSVHDNVQMDNSIFAPPLGKGTEST